jgi:hypothetical protein
MWAILNFENPEKRTRKRSLLRVNAQHDVKLVF